MKKNLWLLLTILVAMALVVAACGGGEEAPPEEPPAAEEPAAEEPAAEEPAAEEPTEEEAMEAAPLLAPPGGFLERAMTGEFAGTTVTVDGPFTDEDEVKFDNSMKAFEEATGIDVQYQGSKEFEAAISVRVDGGDAPDIADFPQPGLAASFAQSGDIVDVSTFIPEDWLKQQYNQSWLDMATMEGPDGPIMAGVWGRYFAKSIVYYPKEPFEASGYEVPQTWDELLALTQQIADDGDTAWCIGVESGAATGWAATDWTEEMMLRTTSLENYDGWTVGTLPFQSPEVKGAIETWSEVWFNDDYVLGGTKSIVTTFFGDAPVPMFEDPPRCWLHKQGNFIVSFFPEGLEYDTDYGIFYLPPVDDAYGRPMLVSGDLFAMFNDRPEVRAAMEYMTTAASMGGYIAGGGGLSPHTDANMADYGNDLERDIAALGTEATSFRFDGSDLMPGEVGAGSFWKGMTDYVSGAADLDTVLAEVDESWPAGVAGQSSAGVGEEDDAGPMMDLPADSFLAQAMTGEFAGTVVTIDGPFTDEDEVKFNQGMEAFEEATGIDVQYQGSKEFEAAISIRIDGGDAPDIADFPQPGLLASFVRQGQVVDPTSWMSEDWLKQQYNQSWLDMAEMEGQSAGVWHRYNAKSLVWYPKAQFEAAGYEIPQTLDELMELTQTIADDGDTPWCIGIESGAATGWPATDWTEEMMLRTTTPENYDAWVAGDLPFSSPEVKEAIEGWSDIWFNDEYVIGGTSSIVTTFFGDSPTPMFEDPPRCWLHRQGNFIISFFPEGVVGGTDYGFFYMPSMEEGDKPWLVAGDIMAMFNDRPEVRATMEYFTTPESAAGFLEQGGALAAHQTATPDMYGQEIERGIAELVQDATVFRFDASDLMPGEVGAGSFWKGMTDYVSGAADLDTVLEEIDASWPR
jgi:alpha-glucoside transport system substrate-binding protein